jgi:hypothetical protein
MADERNAARLAALTPAAELRVRKPSLASQLRVIKAAEKAGLPVRAATIDGVALEFGQPEALPSEIEIQTPDQLRRLI